MKVHGLLLKRVVIKKICHFENHKGFCKTHSFLGILVVLKLLRYKLKGFPLENFDFQ